MDSTTNPHVRAEAGASGHSSSVPARAKVENAFVSLLKYPHLDRRAPFSTFVATEFTVDPIVKKFTNKCTFARTRLRRNSTRAAKISTWIIIEELTRLDSYN